MTTILLTHAPEALANYYGDEALAGLRALADVRLNETGAPLSTDGLIAAADGVEIIVSDRITEGPADVFARLPELAAFVRCAVDIRNVDVAAASEHGVLVTHASPGFVQSVAELTVGMMVDLARGLTDATVAYRNGETPAAVMGRQLSGATLGVIGYGAIGRYLAVLGRALGMSVLVHDPHVTVADAELEQVALPDLLAGADFVVCLAVATAETENLIDAAAFAAMRASACFINVSRGNLVNEAALLAALDSGDIAGAALDVGRAPDQMPSPALAAHPKVIATPHIGGLVPEAIRHQAMETVAQVGAILGGEKPAGAVNFEAAKRLTSAFSNVT